MSKAIRATREAALCGLLLSACGLTAFAQAPVAIGPARSGDVPGATAAIAAPRLYRGHVIHVGDAGAVVECAQVSAAGAKDPATAQAAARFFLRAAPASLYPSADVRFYATEDAPHRYVDFFNLPVSMPALRFVKLDHTPVAPVAIVPPVQPPPARAPEFTATPPMKAGSKNPTPKLKGTSLDEPARRIGR